MSGPLLGHEGSPIIAGEDDDPEDASERCEVCGRPAPRYGCHEECVMQTLAWDGCACSPTEHAPPLKSTAARAFEAAFPGLAVATPDGVFVGEALAAHQRTTQGVRPARVTSVGGRVEREIQLLGALSEIVAAFDQTKAREHSQTDAHDRAVALRETIENARALLVEGSK